MRNIFRSPAFSLRFFDVHVAAPAVSKRISAVLFPCERKGSRGVLLVEIHLPGPILMAKFGGRMGLCPPRVGPIRMANFGDRVGLCPPREASPAVLGVWPFELYLPGPIIMAKFGDRVGLRPPREASPAVLGVCTIELYLPGPIILATFGDRVGLCPPSEASPAVLGVFTVELGISPGAHPFGEVWWSNGSSPAMSGVHLYGQFW